jgi:DNA helicase-2/ATP-dependent DNA helicase PcrA
LRSSNVALYLSVNGYHIFSHIFINYAIIEDDLTLLFFLRDAMDRQIQATAEMAASLLLTRFREAYPSWTDDRTPLDNLAQWLGLQIATFHPDDYAQGTYGFIDPDEDEQLIWLCRDLPETLHRFTLAHEIGHAVLHCRHNAHIDALLGPLATALIPDLSREDPCHDDDIQEKMTALMDQEQFQETLGVGESYDPRSQRELAANIFAAELLMPVERLRTLYIQDALPASNLPATFAVSNAALLNRLAGFLKAPADIAPPHSEPHSPPEQPSSVTQKRYDEFQQAAIEAQTPALIVAGPGSGKTSTLIGRAGYMITTMHVPPQQILALTFSRKAALEMQERLQVLLDDTTSDTTALPKVSTFHAYCADLLRQYGTLVGLRSDFALIDEAEGYFLLRRQSNALRLHHYLKLQSPAYYFPDMLKAISRARDELITPDEYLKLAERMLTEAGNDEDRLKAEQALEIAHVYARYQSALEQRGDTDFGGLLMLAVRLFHKHPEVIQEQQLRYSHILVDEFQDVNRASGIVLRELAGASRRVWVVGDANQAIYGFRGASPANIRQFEQDYPGATVLPLARNYRSLPDLVTLAESFRCTHLEPGEQTGKNQAARPTQLTDSYVTLAQASDDVSEIAGLVADIRYKHVQGYLYSDMIVLCRTRAQAQKITRALAAEQLPVIERAGVLEQEHSKDLLAIPLLLSNESGMGLLRAARQPDHPLSQADIEALLLTARTREQSPALLIARGEALSAISAQGQRSFARLADILSTLQHAPDTWTVLAHYLLIETSLARDLLARQDDKQSRAILADYDRLLQLARHYDQQQRNLLEQHQASQTGNQPPLLAERLKGLLEYLSLLVLLRQDGSRQSTEEQDEKSADIIRVMTVHASKGLEFPVVYMPGLAQRRFPLQARSSPIGAPKGMLAEESFGSAAHESGESCLFYVGLTRARDHLVLSYSERYGKQKYKPSAYLDALEAGLPPERIIRLRWENAQPGDDESLAELLPLKASSQPGESFIQAMKPTMLSASAIEAYQRCPRQYAYSNIYHFTGDTDAYRLFWQATQNTFATLRERLQAPCAPDTPQIPLPTQEEIQQLYTQHWQDLGGHMSHFAVLYEEHGHEIVESLRRRLSTRNEIAWQVRPAFNVDVAGKTVQVTVDRLESEAASTSQQSRPTRLVRTRFGKRKEKPPAEMRDLFYLLASRQLHPGQSIELHSHNLSTDEAAPITMTARKEQSLYDEAARSIEGLERNEFPARPAEPFRCPTCPFFLICPA